MKQIYMGTKILYLFFPIYAYTLTCAAQNVHAAAAHYAVSEKEGQIILTDGKNKDVISSGTNDTLPVITGNEVYYVSNASFGTIFVYNILDKSKTDILKSSGNSEYTFKDAIATMILDKASNTLYFSTVSINSKGLPDYLTWTYNINTRQLAVYKDGIVESIDQQGNQTVVFYGMDYKGSYSKKNIYAKDGSVNQSFDKVYAVSLRNNKIENQLIMKQ